MAPSPHFSGTEYHALNTDIDKTLWQLQRCLQHLEADKDPRTAPHSERSMYVAQAIRRTVSNAMSVSASLSFDQYSEDGTFEELEGEFPMHSTPRQSRSHVPDFAQQCQCPEVSLTSLLWSPEVAPTISSPDPESSEEEMESDVTVLRRDLSYRPTTTVQLPLNRIIYLPETPNLNATYTSCFPLCVRPSRKSSLCKRLRKLGGRIRRRLLTSQKA